MTFLSLPQWLGHLATLDAPHLTLAMGLACAAPATPPVVHITFVNRPPEVTHTLDHNALGQFNASTTFAKHTHETFLTGGITESNIKTDFQIGFRQTINRAAGQACISVEKIDITLSYKPVVHMAREFPAGSCRFNTTWEHELRHVNTDVITLRERGPLLQQAAYKSALQIGAVGPVSLENLALQQKHIVTQVGAAIEAAFQDIDRLRMHRQQLIDTREEYLRLSRACPDR